MIEFDEKFIKLYKKIPAVIQKKLGSKLLLFRENPFHPSLRLHKLSGKLTSLRSISIDKSYRILFDIPREGFIRFISIGNHSVYEK